MSIDSSLISLALKNPNVFTELRRQGVNKDFFVGDWERVWRWATTAKSKHGSYPSLEAAGARFGDLDFVPARRRDYNQLVYDLQQRKRFFDFQHSLELSMTMATDPEEVDAAIAELQGSLNRLAYHGGEAVVDLFSETVKDRMVAEIAQRRKNTVTGIQTGLKHFDWATGGLQRHSMNVIMARTGLGKSWLNLLFVARGILEGNKVLLLPLEMSLEETTLRLYTIFSYQIFGERRVLKNRDLQRGRVVKSKLLRLMDYLHDNYEGQLFIADIGATNEPFTPERLEAEVELNRPDMFWVDYLTLMKVPGTSGGDEDYRTVKTLSNAIKQIAMRHHTVGGASAQVSREALKTKAFLPRPEHLSFGDSIAHDADTITSLNRKGEYLYYGLVKNRNGPEVSRKKLLFNVDSGEIAEAEFQDDEDDLE